MKIKKEQEHPYIYIKTFSHIQGKRAQNINHLLVLSGLRPMFVSLQHF